MGYRACSLEQQLPTLFLTTRSPSLFKRRGTTRGDDHEHQYVYPQEHAPELAKRTNQNVLSMGNEMTKNMATHSTSASDSRIQQMEQADVTGVSPSEERVKMIVIIAANGEK